MLYHNNSRPVMSAMNASRTAARENEMLLAGKYDLSECATTALQNKQRAPNEALILKAFVVGLSHARLFLFFRHIIPEMSIRVQGTFDERFLID